MSGRYDGRIVSSFTEEIVSTPQNYSITCRVVWNVGCSRPPYHNPLPCRRTVSARAIEDPVWQKIEEVLQNPELIASEVQRRTKHADTEQGTLNSERDCFTRQLEQCDKEMKKWEA